MAVAYASKNAATLVLSATPQNITLPSGMADGELLLIHFHQVGSDDAETVFNVSGGTLLERIEYDNSSGYHTAGLWYKYVNATDISNNYMTVNGSDSYSITARINLYRVSGSVASIDSNAVNINADATPEYSVSLTPTVTGSLLFIMASGTSGVSGSTYAIATSNPSWTEITDEVIENMGGTDDPVILGAHATRTEVTATGNASLTFGASTDSVGILVCVNPVTNISLSPTVLELTSSVVAPSVTAGATVTIASSVDVTASVVAPTVSFPADDWTNQTKNSSTWTNQSKS